MFTANVFAVVINAMDCSPWATSSGRGRKRRQPRRTSLYTAEERVRRDNTVWTVVQGVLAPIQFLIFLVSLAVVLRFLLTGEGQSVAEFSVVVKTLVLYTIMITGAIWEREVFGRYLFAPAFFWEDVVSMLVLALHSAYLVALYQHALAPVQLMLLALAAYGTYVINAAQFVMKLRAAKRGESWQPGNDRAMGAA